MSSHRPEFEESGVHIKRSAIHPDDASALLDEAQRLFEVKHPGRVMEADGETVRGIHGCHMYSKPFEHLVALKPLVATAEDLLGGEVYVYQVKVNAKQPTTGEAWPWHQDYIFWQVKDGLPEPRALTVGVLLDPATPDNGPLTVLRGSHHDGVIASRRHTAVDTEGETSWRQDLAADLAFTVSEDVAKGNAHPDAAVTFTGSPGDAIFFHSCSVHASGPNRSDRARTLALITYNRTDNLPVRSGREPRPDFLCATDTSAVRASSGSRIGAAGGATSG